MKSMAKVSERVEWVDIAKGYGILLVIAAHMDISTLGVWIHTFHIPVFFFLSGYVFNEKVEFNIFLKKKIKALVVPYFCLGIPLIVYDILQKCVEKYNLKEVIIEDVCGFLVQKRMFTLWYIATLFLLNILFYLLVKCVRNYKILGIISIGIMALGTIYYRMGGIALIWNIDVCMMALPFFYFGYIFRKDKKIQEYIFENKNKKLIFIIMLALNLICGLGTCIFGGEVLSMYGSTYGIEPLTYISAFAGIICIIMISKKTTLSSLKYLGENSLLYFAWHQSLIIPLIYDVIECFGIFDFETEAMLLLVKAIVFIICLGILTGLNIAISKSKLKFIIGR